MHTCKLCRRSTLPLIPCQVHNCVYDTIEAHIRGLAALGKSKDAYGTIFVPIILGKLPVDVHHNLAHEHGNSEWIIRKLKDAILKEIRV